MAKEVVQSFCKRCGFAIFVGWQHKCALRKAPEKPQDKNGSGAFLVVAPPKTRGR